MFDDFSRILVIGSGTMGSGIALVFAQAGFEVRLLDLNQELLDKGMNRINLYLEKSIERKRLSQNEVKQIKSKISPVLSLEEAILDIQLVIEAIVEDSDAKQDLFKKLDKLCDSSVIFASNTSAISITNLASATSRPEKFLGMHFFNPPSSMKLVELIKGDKTDEKVLDSIVQLCDKIGKIAVPSNEGPGFIVNRLLWPFLNESYKMIEEGIASKENIDAAVKLGLNHPMGPFELTDYIGLDVLKYIGDYIASELGDEYKPATILEDLVKQGKLGRKTREGFYKYE